MYKSLDDIEQSVDEHSRHISQKASTVETVREFPIEG